MPEKVRTKIKGTLWEILEINVEHVEKHHITCEYQEI
jgi:hypothetical protein